MIYAAVLVLLLFGLLPACNAPQEEAKSEPVTEAAVAGPSVDARLVELGIELPNASNPVANYVNAVRTGNLLFLAGKGPQKPDGTYITGKVGADRTIEEGYEAARLTAINQLAVLKAELGSLDKVKRIVKVLGMVNAVEDFTNQPEVINP